MTVKKETRAYALDGNYDQTHECFDISALIHCIFDKYTEYVGIYVYNRYGDSERACVFVGRKSVVFIDGPNLSFYNYTNHRNVSEVRKCIKTVLKTLYGIDAKVITHNGSEYIVYDGAAYRISTGWVLRLDVALRDSMLMKVDDAELTATLINKKEPGPNYVKKTSW